jgi:tRNA-2-methylthio-N6-dimethylallyladenosine synthase
MTKKLFIKTYGCQMNVYDSVKMGDLLKPHGFSVQETPDDADMVILNTCHIREKASEKVYSELGRIRQEKERLHNDGRKMVIAVAGCVAQAEGEEIIKRAPFVDIVVGPQSYQNLPSLLEQIKRNNSWAMDLDFHHEAKFDNMPAEVSSQGISAFVSVQEGCDKFCHFCVVPYTRGAEFSRSVPEIIRETMKLIQGGATEITLLGQNVSAFHGIDDHGKEVSLGTLISYLTELKGLKRLRYLTSHPRDMIDEELFAQHALNEKLMPFLHLPIQAGSDKILQAMNRKHTREFYLDLIAKFRAARPDMAFSSDFIVGYPGETEEDFADTISIVREVGFALCFSFKYSPRPGTPASVLTNQVPEDIKDERLQRLQAVIAETQLAFNQKQVGRILPVLFEKTGKKKGQLAGKSPYLQTVLINAPEEIIGTIVDVEITAAYQNSLQGILA